LNYMNIDLFYNYRGLNRQMNNNTSNFIKNIKDYR